MAAGQCNRSRRALLGAAVGLSFSSFETGLRQAQPLLRMSGEDAEAPGPLHPAPRPGKDFHAALAAYRAAEAEVRGFEGANAGRPFVAEDPLDEVYGELGDVMYDALRLLLKAPAPDVAALAVKLELVVEHEVGTLDGGEACLAAICGDARRLAGG